MDHLQPLNNSLSRATGSSPLIPLFSSLIISRAQKASSPSDFRYPGQEAHSARKVSTRREGIVYEVQVSGDGSHRSLAFDMHGALLSNKKVEVVAATPDTVKAGPKLPVLFKKGEGR